ncbi:hypothetical protein M5X11_28055 [Paenibacillus alginolyticus]|uniref:hypothetical protein n=1 Tax=Paenibacillus alginolyticus TaxID=59839 RepID=UPI00041100E9|nr:hypothetical protein [Paenibacillus alginolyticus]MCY9668732.1 hypothetical protein [Paenibacillus alginolyticus]
MWVLVCLGIVSLFFIAYRFRQLESGEASASNPEVPKEKGSRLRTIQNWTGDYLLPDSYASWLKKRISAAGKLAGMTVEKLYFRQCVAGAFGLILAAILPQRGGWLFVLFMGGLGFLFPLFQLHSPARRHEKEVRIAVRNWLMLLIPLLEGNLHFQSTLFDVFRRIPGSLNEEVNRMTVQFTGGRSLREALWDAVARVPVREFVQLVRVLMDGDRYGPQEMAGRLKELKNRMDRHDRRRAKKQIKDAVTRLFFVVLLFIFVPILILGFLILMQSMKKNVTL